LIICPIAPSKLKIVKLGAISVTSERPLQAPNFNQYPLPKSQDDLFPIYSKCCNKCDFKIKHTFQEFEWGFCAFISVVPLNGCLYTLGDSFFAGTRTHRAGCSYAKVCVGVRRTRYGDSDLGTFLKRLIRV
jgi:hypothetical protein